MYTSMMRKALFGSGDTATLSLDFSAGTVPTAVTFTRADSTARATYIDANGYVKTVTAAGDARFDYTGGVAKGLLIEQSAINLLLNGKRIHVSLGGWFFGGSGTTVTTPDYSTGPDGVSSSATRLQLSQNCSLKQVAGTINTNHTASVWAKSNDSNSYNLAFWTGSTGSAKVITPQWQRFESVINFSATPAFDFYKNDAGICDISVWGAQVELGSNATSTIPTVASSLTRLADDAVISSTAWTGLYSKPGTIVVEYYRGEYGAGDRSVLAIDTAITKHIHLKHANGSAASGIYNSAGSGVANKAAGNASGLNKACFSWSSANPSTIKYALNGNATVVSGSSDIGATLGTWMTIGSASTTGVSGSGTWEGYLNNCIKSVKYYSELLSDADMIAKTT